MKRSPEAIQAFLEAHALRMKQEPTAAEKRLWEALEGLGGWEFQRPILIPGKATNQRPYIMDFFSPAKMLCVEVDGSSHRFRVGRDGRRDGWLRRMGIRTLRFSNGDVMHRLEQTLAAIRAACEETKDG